MRAQPRSPSTRRAGSASSTTSWQTPFPGRERRKRARRSEREPIGARCEPIQRRRELQRTWHNPTDDSLWNYEWAGYKYHFNIRCEGDNIETITYEIEGKRSYFDIIDRTATPKQQAKGVHAYHSPKTVTLDYDLQESIDDGHIVEIYTGFPLSE